MRSILVVVDPPVLDRGADLVDAQEPVLVEALVAKFPVEALDIGVLDWSTGRDEEKPNTTAIGPFVESTTRKLRAIIDDDGLRNPTELRKLVEPAHNACSRDGSRRIDPSAFPAEIVYHVQGRSGPSPPGLWRLVSSTMGTFGAT